ncbi:MAG TPA: lipid-binding SYLF domain-containing protein [Steroidobacteraceae bacterium]|jgi:lipid-binding SYLF domain-containing protein|nr:lipid-binding SYLF domain-containing protein [Steroidobacteraceae bacterium]
MRRSSWLALYAAAALTSPFAANANNYADAITNFRAAGESRDFFHSAYAYAVFPNVGEGALVVGGQIGKGRVYRNGHLLGYSTIGGLSLGFQAGGQVYSEIVFFEDEHALQEFESGNFQFAAGAHAVAITAGAGASVATNGVQANASGTAQNATTAGAYERGMAVFTVAKGGLIYAAAVGGQHFSYRPRAAS